MALLGYDSGDPFASAQVLISVSWVGHESRGGVYRHRPLTHARVTWPCDDSGGESVPTTYTNGADTLHIIDEGPQISYGKPTGKYEAVYEHRGSLVVVP